MELKPCPFCGGEAERIELQDEANFGGDVICCKRCQASSAVEFGFKENIISSWNRRADVAVRVKPLEWVRSGGAHVLDNECHTVPTGYTVRYADENGWKWSAMGFGAYGWEPSPTMAQNAAQADHERRILAALDLAPISGKVE